MAALKEKRTELETQRRNCGQIIRRVQEAAEAMESASSELTQWDESIIRQLVDTVKVLPPTASGYICGAAWRWSRKLERTPILDKGAKRGIINIERALPVDG